MSRPENKDSASVKQQTLDILTHSLKKTDPAYSTITAILDRFLPSQFDSSDSMLEAYTQLSTAQEQALHEKIKASIVASSTTASGEAEKSGRIKRDISPQDSKSAKKQLNLAYDFMIKLAKAKVPLSVDIVVALQRILVPNYSGLRTENQLGKPGAFFVHHEQVKSLLQNLIAFINNPPPSMALTTVKAIAQSIFLSIHPFHDGNGRTNMLVDVYAAILHDSIPQIFADPKQQSRFLLFTELSPEGIKNGTNILGFNEAHTSGVTPTNLSPYCLQQLRDADIRIPDTWIIGGAKLTYSGLQTSIAKKIMASLQTNHAKALAIITEAQALASPSLDQEDSSYDLLTYLLDTNTVISSKLHEKLLAASMLQSGEQLPPGKLTKALALNWNELFTKILPTVLSKNSTPENFQALQQSINRLQKLCKIIQKYYSDFIKSQDIYNLSQFLDQVESSLPNLQRLASAPEPIRQVWKLVNDVIDMGKAIGIDRCYISPFLTPISEFKTCAWEFPLSGITPDPLELSQTNSAVRILPPSGLPLLAAAVCMGSGMGQVMLGIFAAYQLGKQISKIRLSTSTATLLSKTSQNSPAKPASDPHPNGTDYLVCSTR